MPLIVVQVLPALETGGVERSTLEVARGLVRAGHRSIVVAAGGRMARPLLQSGSEHIDWPIGAKSPLAFRYIPRLRRLLRERNPDILHARSRLPAWIAWLAWRGLPVAQRPRFVTTMHGVHRVSRYSRIMTMGERVIAVSEFVRDHMLEYYPHTEPGRIRVIPRGVDPARYPYGYRPDAAWLQKWWAQYPQLEHKTLITLPARLTRRKGQVDLINVFVTLRNRGMLHGLHGLIAGSGRRGAMTRLQQRINAAGLDRDITLLGHRDDLREIMAISGVVLSLSGLPEAFGRTAIEALSLGKPVIGYAHGGTAEILQRLYPDGLVTPGDIGTTCDRLLTFIRQPPPVPHEQPYTLDRMLASTLALYHELAVERRDR